MTDPTQPDKIATPDEALHNLVLASRANPTLRGWVQVVEDEIERLRDLVAVRPQMTVDFAEAEVGDHAFTWERADGGDFGDYRFETGDDPRGLYDDDFPVIRRRWMLVEATRLPARDEGLDDDRS